MTPEYRTELSHRIDQVFSEHPDLRDHRSLHPWLIGALGDPEAGIWFVGENPSLRQVERARNPDGGDPTEEAQWFASRGDKLLRQTLILHSFKTGTADSLGGWGCYITNVVKEADYAKKWRSKSAAALRGAAETWSAVLRWELEHSNPVLVVTIGHAARRLLVHLERHDRISLPEIAHVRHYSGVALRPAGHLGPMHPDRVRAFEEDLGRVRQRFDELTRPD